MTATISSNATPHRKNAARRTERSSSPYQQRTSQKNNPTQLLIKQAVQYLIQQLEAGHSETLAAYLRTMGRLPEQSLHSNGLALPAASSSSVMKTKPASRTPSSTRSCMSGIA